MLEGTRIPLDLAAFHDNIEAINILFVRTAPKKENGIKKLNFSTFFQKPHNYFACTKHRPNFKSIVSHRDSDQKKMPFQEI